MDDATRRQRSNGKGDLPKAVAPKAVTKVSLAATIADIEKFHSPKYPLHDPEDPDRRTVCAGCEVFWWPCPTIQIVRGTWRGLTDRN